MSTDRLYQIDAPHFCCGIILQDGKVMQCAPIVKYMVGWRISAVQRYCQRKGWTCEPIRSKRNDVELSSDQSPEQK